MLTNIIDDSSLSSTELSVILNQHAMSVAENGTGERDVQEVSDGIAKFVTHELRRG